MEKVLTVVVPMYNIEAYIHDCLESFCISKIMGKLEVLVIDDGSKDNSSNIAESFEEMYPEIFRVIHKENGGHGSAINRGICEATGKYFKVVDGDDWVECEAFKTLVGMLEASDTDMVCSDFKWVFNGTGQEKVGVKEPFSGAVYGKEYRFTEVSDGLYIKMHSMTIKTEILKSHFKPLDEHCFYVDWEYTAYPIPYVNTVTFIPDCVYMYRVGLEGQSVNIKNMQKNIKHHLTVLHSLMNFYEEHYGTVLENVEGEARKKAEYLAKLIGRVVASQVKIYLSFPANKENKENLKAFDREIKKKNYIIYSHVENKSVKLLRKTNFRLYKIAAYLVAKRG